MTDNDFPQPLFHAALPSTTTTNATQPQPPSQHRITAETTWTPTTHLQQPSIPSQGPAQTMNSTSITPVTTTGVSAVHQNNGTPSLTSSKLDDQPTHTAPTAQPTVPSPTTSNDPTPFTHPTPPTLKKPGKKNPETNDPATKPDPSEIDTDGKEDFKQSKTRKRSLCQALKEYSYVLIW
jgi:hypothetical protein